MKILRLILTRLQMPKEIKRCPWPQNDQLMTNYHDKEWGVPVHDDNHLFEVLCLDGAQAGLSWRTILHKRENYRKAFDGFDVRKVALYGDKKVDELLGNAGIVRNRLKIRSAIRNANVFVEIQKEFGTFDSYLWGFTKGKTIDGKRVSMQSVPATTTLSDTISKDLKKRGMNFVGSTIIYAVLQSMGIVNDHRTDCFRYKQIKRQQLS